MGKRAAGFLLFRRLNSTIEYLLLKASYGSHHWTPPKGIYLLNCANWPQSFDSYAEIHSTGHVDPGEDDFTTALRETREEAGYSADDLIVYKDLSKTLAYEVKGKPKTVIYWLAELRDPQKDPILSDEHTEFRWLAKADAVSLSGYRDFANMVDYFHEKIGKL